MLNGAAPLFIFSIPPGPKTTQAISGIPILKDIVGNVGIPIPIYLDEQFTKLYVSAEEKAIDIDNDVVPQYAGGAQTFQRPLDSIVTINLFGKKDSTALIILLAMCDLVFSKLKYGYGISYLNGPTTLFGGVLKTFSTHVTNEDDLIRVVVQLSRANQKPGVTALNAGQGTTTLSAQGGTVNSAVTPVGSSTPIKVPPPASQPSIPIGGAGT